ncbi:hypothetical protein BD769DRAFT_861412 [Suillus cothurnatus]|nr:hypothetical protein BD769DRAFT_861412 [Suillus cothurnatus]
MSVLRKNGLRDWGSRSITLFFLQVVFLACDDALVLTLWSNVGTIHSSSSIYAPSPASMHRLCSGSLHETGDQYMSLSCLAQTMQMTGDLIERK